MNKKLRVIFLYADSGLSAAWPKEKHINPNCIYSGLIYSAETSSALFSEAVLTVLRSPETHVRLGEFIGTAGGSGADRRQPSTPARTAT